MFKKKKLLCTTAVCLALGGFAGVSGAATSITQADFTNPGAYVAYDEPYLLFSFKGGEFEINSPVQITVGPTSGMLNDNSLKIGAGTILNVSGGLDLATNPNLGLLDVTALFIDGGALNVTGSTSNFTSGGFAVAVHNDVFHTSGTVNVTGGSGNNATGLGLAGEYNLSGGTLITSGGTGTDSVGVGVGLNMVTSPEVDFEQTGGQLRASGGSGQFADGLYVVGSVRLGNGSIHAEGGSGGDSKGIYAVNDMVVSGGSVFAEGGSGIKAYGIEIVKMFNLKNGTVTAQGGSGVDSSGITADSFSQNGGTLKAIGSSTEASASGVWVSGAVSTSPDFLQYGGAVVAQGNVASGIKVGDVIANGNFTQSGGSVNATAGVGDAAGIEGHGITTYNFTQNAGNVIASGSVSRASVGTTYNAGINVTAKLIQQGGSMLAVGGGTASNNSYGIAANELEQSAGGKFVAYGGEGVNAYGLNVSTTATLGGSFTAYAGTGNNAIGANFGDNVTVGPAGTIAFGNAIESGTPNINKGIIIHNTAGTATLTANAGATVSPVVNLDPNNMTVGTLNADVITLDTTGTGVTLKPVLKNTIFYDSTAAWNNDSFMTGNITGDFVNVPNNGDKITNLFFEFTFDKTNPNDLKINNITRLQSMSDVIGGLGENTQALINAMANGLSTAGVIGIQNNNTMQMLEAMYSELENAANMQEFASKAAFARNHLTNQAGTRLAHFSMQQLDVVQTALSREINAAQKLPYWQFWAKGIFHDADVKYKSDEFVKSKEDFSGIVIGAARDFRYVTFSGQAHYLTGKVKSKEFYKADVDNFGFIVGARVHDVVNPKGVFNPWFDVNFAYSYMDADQTRSTIGYNGLNIYTTKADSKAKANIFRIGMIVGNTFNIGSVGTIAPQIGFDYTNIRQNGYSEHSDGVALRTGKTTFESLRPKIGAEAEIYLNEYIYADFRAFYYYETMDQRMVYNNSFSGMPSFKTKGDKLDRSSGNLGVGLNVAFNEQVSAGVSYDLWLRDKYTAHQFAVELRVNF